MKDIIIGSLILFFGSLSTLFGLFVVFSPKFLSWLRDHIWKEDKSQLSEEMKDGVDKWLRGYDSIVVGIILIILAIAILLT